MIRINIFLLILLYNFNAWSSETTFDKLLVEVNAGTTFTQITSNPHCPSSIKLVEEEKKHLPIFAQEGDRSVRLQAYSANNRNPGFFTHERNSLFFRPGLNAGVSHTLNRELKFILGLAYIWAGQSDHEGVLTSEYYSRVLSPAMIATGHSKVSYDSNENKLHYFFQANGIEDVLCSFLKQTAP